MKRASKIAFACTAALAVLSGAAMADDASCKNVRLGDVGWTDIAATSGLTSVVLEGLGYKPATTIASIPITFAGLKSKQLDVFLGYWNPSMTPVIEPFEKKGDLTVLKTPNLTGAKYTLAVPSYLADKGLKDFKDIAKFKDELGGKIYGIEPGNDGNQLIQKMIEKNAFGLKDFKLVESSEAGMLVEAVKAFKQGKPIVFLGWEPHPMNAQMKMTYLTGGDEYFGPNLGGATVYTVTSKGYGQKCPNVATLLGNLQFSLKMEKEVMGPIKRKADPVKTAKDWLKKNPQVLDSWLKGVKTIDGQDGLPAVKKYVGV